MQSAMPAVIILLSLLLYGEKTSAVQLLGVSISIVGASVIVMRGSWDAFIGLSLVQGDLWMMVAVVLYACYSVLLRKRPAMHPLSFLTLTFGIGVLSLLPLYLWELSWTRPSASAVNVLLTTMYLAVFPSILAYLFWNRGIELIGANRGGLFINLIPVFASLLAILC
jgi:drug/metabolite transporter (DMT)-like permease